MRQFLQRLHAFTVLLVALAPALLNGEAVDPVTAMLSQCTRAEMVGSDKPIPLTPVETKQICSILLSFPEDGPVTICGSYHFGYNVTFYHDKTLLGNAMVDFDNGLLEISNRKSPHNGAMITFDTKKNKAARQLHSLLDSYLPNAK